VLVSGRLLRVRLLAFLQVPNFKTAAAANEHYFTFQSGLLAKIDRQNEAALFVGGGVLGPGMQLSKENAAVARRNARIGFGGGAHTRKFFRRHDQKKLVSRFRKNDEFLGRTSAPACGNGDAIFFVDEVTKFAGVETLFRLLHLRVGNCSILTHFSPLLTTFRAQRQQKLIAFFDGGRRPKWLPEIKYDAADWLEQETRLAKDDSVINKIVYQYDPVGKQVGYSMFDATGKLISSSPAPAPSSKPHKPLGR
jgi:hypothetical protein